MYASSIQCDIPEELIYDPDTDVGVVIESDASIVHKALNDYRMGAPGDANHEVLAACLGDILSTVASKQFADTIGVLKAHNVGVKRYKTEVVVQDSPVSLTPIASHFLNGLELVSKVSRNAPSMFDISDSDYRMIHKDLSQVQAAVDDTMVRNVNGARRERAFKNVKLAIDTLGLRGKIDVLDFSFNSKSWTAVQRVMKMGRSVYDRINSLTVLLQPGVQISPFPKSLDGSLDCFKNITFDVHYVSVSNIGEFAMKLVEHNAEAVRLRTAAEAESGLLVEDFLRDHFDQVYSRIPSVFALIVTYGDHMNNFDAATFPTFMDYVLDPQGCFVINSMNPAIYTDPMYAINAGFYNLGPANPYKGKKTEIVLDTLTNCVYRDVIHDWGEFAAACSRSGVAINVQRGANIAPPFPSYAAPNTTHLSEFGVIKHEGSSMVVVGWRYEIPILEPISIVGLLGKKVKKASVPFKAPTHNKPEYASLADLRHIICDSAGVYAAPKLDGVKCLLYVYANKYILVSKNNMTGYIVERKANYPSTDNVLAEIPCLTHKPLYVIQCEHVPDGYANHFGKLGDLVAIDILDARSTKPVDSRYSNSYFRFKDACFESRYNLLKSVCAQLHLPVQDYKLSRDLNFSKEGLVFQPRLAPLNVVSFSKNTLRSGSCAIKMAILESSEEPNVVELVDSLDYSIDAYHDDGIGNYVHRLVELRSSYSNEPVQSVVQAKLDIVGYKVTSDVSSIGLIPPDVALLSDLEKLRRLAASPTGKKNPVNANLSKTFAWRHFLAIANLLYITGAWNGIPASVNDMKRMCLEDTENGPHAPGAYFYCDGCAMHDHYQRLQQVHKSLQIIDTSKIGLLKKIESRFATGKTAFVPVPNRDDVP
jgi:hypothetical protein